MSDPRTPHDPIDPLDARRTGSAGMPTWAWAAIAGVVLLLAVVFLWPSDGVQQAGTDTTPPAATSPTTPPPAASPPAQQTPPATTPPAKQ